MLNFQKIVAMFDELVPAEGPAETVAGEIIRAANRLVYHALNDGDVFWDDYGIETVGPIYEYFTGLSDYEFERNDLYSKLITVLEAMRFTHYDDNEELLQDFIDAVVALVEGCPTLKTIANDDDCLACGYYDLAIEDFGDPNYDPDEEEDYNEDDYDPDDDEE